MNEHHFEDEYEYPPRPWWHRAFFSAVALLIAISLIWTYQIRPFFLYRETPPVNIAPVVSSELLIDERGTIVIPLRIIIARDGAQTGSSRDDLNVRQLSANAEAVWNQADVAFEIVDITEQEMSDAEVDIMFEDPAAFWSALRPPDDNAVIVVLTRTLRGSNGISWPAFRGFAVADVTTVPDYRAYAHELGHLLGLSHVRGSRARLMFQGANGSSLDKEEIISARAAAIHIWGPPIVNMSVDPANR